MFMVISDRTGCLFTIGNLYCSFPGTRALLCCDGNSPNRRDFGIVAATEAADVGDVGADASADADGSADADVCACGAADDGKSFDLAAVAPFSPNTPPRYLYEFPSAARKNGKGVWKLSCIFSNRLLSRRSRTYFAHILRFCDPLLRICRVPLFRDERRDVEMAQLAALPRCSFF